jgi:hypothetical protein
MNTTATPRPATGKQTVLPPRNRPEPGRCPLPHQAPPAACARPLQPPLNHPQRQSTHRTRTRPRPAITHNNTPQSRQETITSSQRADTENRRPGTGPGPRTLWRDPPRSSFRQHPRIFGPHHPRHPPQPPPPASHSRSVPPHPTCSHQAARPYTTTTVRAAARTRPPRRAATSAACPTPARSPPSAATSPPRPGSAPDPAHRPGITQPAMQRREPAPRLQPASRPHPPPAKVKAQPGHSDPARQPTARSPGTRTDARHPGGGPPSVTGTNRSITDARPPREHLKDPDSTTRRPQQSLTLTRRPPAGKTQHGATSNGSLRWHPPPV